MKDALKIAESLQKKYGDEVVVKSGRKMEIISTGSLSLNCAIGVGGWPRGRICDLYGRESAGKSMVAQLAVAEAQKAGGMPAYIDAENGFDEKWARVLGVDTSPEKLLRLSPECGEQAFDMAEDLIKQGIDLIIIDSTAALVPKDCVEKAMEDGMIIGRQAALISRGLQKLLPIVTRNKSTVIFIGQVRKNIGLNPHLHQEEESPTGGLALGFYSSVRIRVRRKEAIKDGDKLIGHRIECFLKKNKVAVPLKTTSFNLMYYNGVDQIAELFDTAVELGILQRPTNVSYVFGERKWTGQEKMREAIISDPTLQAEILEAIRKSNV